MHMHTHTNKCIIATLAPSPPLPHTHAAQPLRNLLIRQLLVLVVVQARHDLVELLHLGGVTHKQAQASEHLQGQEGTGGGRQAGRLAVAAVAGSRSAAMIVSYDSQGGGGEAKGGVAPPHSTSLPQDVRLIGCRVYGVGLVGCRV